MNSLKKTFIVINILVLTIGNSIFAYGATQPEIAAETAILIDQDSGKVLYEKEPDKKMYPASITKVLTALVAVDYIKEDDIIFAGPEVNNVPLDSSKAGTKNGEAIRGDNLLRLLIIPSGNETAAVIAQTVAEEVTGNKNISYEEAEVVFATLMNEKAKSLGATNSNFINPHGYHDENHYTTAKDMALICKAAMENPLINEIVSETQFVGNGAGENPDPTWKTQDYNLKTHNLLISEGEFAYQYATGIKTGFTDQAGDCIAAAASKNGLNLIAVILNSPDPGRWNDAKLLFDYGFENYSVKSVQTVGASFGELPLSNSKLGENEKLAVKAKNGYETLLSQEEFDRIEKKVEYDSNLMVKEEEENITEGDGGKFLAPIVNGQVMGKVTYTLDGQVLFEDDIVSTRDVAERTIKSDISYYFHKTVDFMFSVKGIPVWIGIVVIIVLIVLIIKRIKRKRNRNYYRLSKRY